MTDTTTTTTTATCGAARNITGCAAPIFHNGAHVTAAEIAQFGNTYAAQTATNAPTQHRAFWATVAAAATIAF